VAGHLGALAGDHHLLEIDPDLYAAAHEAGVHPVVGGVDRT
jgi:hypothetical protein